MAASATHVCVELVGEEDEEDYLDAPVVGEYQRKRVGPKDQPAENDQCEKPDDHPVCPRKAACPSTFAGGEKEKQEKHYAVQVRTHESQSGGVTCSQGHVISQEGDACEKNCESNQTVEGQKAQDHRKPLGC